MAEANPDNGFEDLTPSDDDSPEQIVYQEADEPLLQRSASATDQSILGAPNMRKRVKKRVTKSINKVAKALGKCRCDRTACMQCTTRKLDKYKKLVNESERRDAIVGESVRMQFNLEDPPSVHHLRITVTKNMTVLDVVKTLSLQRQIKDFTSYSLFEYWMEYQAYRRMEDHELIWNEWNQQVIGANKHQFEFLFRIDLEKYDWVSQRFMLFYHPEEVNFYKDQNSLIDKTAASPGRILLRCSFVHKEVVLFGSEEAKKSVQDLLETDNEQSDYYKSDTKKLSSQPPLSSDEKAKMQQILRESLKSTGAVPKTTGLHSKTTEKPSTSTGTAEFPEVIIKESIKPSTVENFEPVPSTSKAATSEISMEMLRSTDSQEEKDLASAPATIPTGIEYPSPFAGKLTRWRMPLALAEILNVSNEDDYDHAYDPVYCGQVLARKGRDDLTIQRASKIHHRAEDTVWVKRYLLLRNKHLYFVKSKDLMYKYYLMSDLDFRELHESLNPTPQKEDTLRVIGHVSNFRAFFTVKVRHYFNPPTGGTICLRELNASSDPLRLMFCSVPWALGDQENVADFFSYSRYLWMTAFAFARYGSKMLTSYYQYHSLKQAFLRWGDSQVDTEDVRVPMDYSQGYGRIIKDEKEIEELKKGIRYNKKTRFIEQEEKEILHQGLHMTQKYYHKKISKRSAENKVLKVGKDGAWLLRNGERRPGTLFVVYYYDKNVYHKQIKVASFNDQYTRSSRYVVSTDLNVAFHDVHSLLQFYRLNTGGEFKCKLGESIKDPEQPDDSPPRFNVRPLSIEKKSTSSVKSAFSSFRSKKSSEKSPPKTQPDKPEN